MTQAEALKKYAACYTGQNPENFRSIEQGKAIVARLRAEGFKIRGLFPQFVAQGGNAVNADYWQDGTLPEPTAEQMAAEGFPVDKPINLTILGNKEWHDVSKVERWMNEGLWNWGMKYMLMWWW